MENSTRKVVEERLIEKIMLLKMKGFSHDYIKGYIDAYIDGFSDGSVHMGNQLREIIRKA